MITAKYLKEHIEEFFQSCKKRKIEVDFGSFTQLEEERIRLLKLSENKKAEINSLSKEVGESKSKGEEPLDLLRKLQKSSFQVKEYRQKLAEVQEEINHFINELPNILDEKVPVGDNKEKNTEVKKVGVLPTFSFKPRSHFEIAGENYLDFSRAGKMSGSRFVVLRKELARLERALIEFFLNENRERGYEEIAPPTLVNEKSIYGTGQLPKFQEEVFHLSGSYENFYLIPTAEVPLTNLYREEEIPEKLMPMHFTAITNCYRAEAGSAGKDTKGLMRLHEFKKVELVKITFPEKSEEEHNKMVLDAENLLEKLEIPYRVILLCSGDTGFSASKCYDIEVWVPSENNYREISSCSNCRDFQSRRSNIRIRRKNGTLDFAHTLNGSALPLGRTLIALLENHQKEDGTVVIPKALKKYFGKDTVRFLNE